MKGTALARKGNVNHDFVSRRSGRAVPNTSVTVALLDENVPVAYGIVRDLSEIGACIMTDALNWGQSMAARLIEFLSMISSARPT